MLIIRLLATLAAFFGCIELSLLMGGLIEGAELFDLMRVAIAYAVRVRVVTVWMA